MSKRVTIEDVLKAKERIEQVVQCTPCGHSRSASMLLRCETFLKFENQQLTGSFKVRGSLNKMLVCKQEAIKRQVVACSAGNHAQGLAFSATYVGSKAHVVMPEGAALVKSEATRQYGGEVLRVGKFFDEALAHAKKLAKEKNYMFVHPFEDELIIAGQGTLGLELVQQVPSLDAVVVPIGGGGLMAGVATALKAKNPQIKIYGAVAKEAPGMWALFHGKQTQHQPRYISLADGIAVKQASAYMHQNYIAPLVDDIVCVSEDEIAEAMVFLLERTKTLVEGSGAVCLAAAHKAQKAKLWDLGKRLCLVLSGGNVDLNSVPKIINRGMLSRGRMARIEVVVGDRPGELERLAGLISSGGANILEVQHDRLDPGLGLGETRIGFLIEARNSMHVNTIKGLMRKHMSL